MVSKTDLATGRVFSKFSESKRIIATLYGNTELASKIGPTLSIV